MKRTSFPDIYARDSKGRPKVWSIKVINGQPCQVVSKSGLFGGSLSVQVNNVANGKNAGKANETTALEQAYADAESKWNKKKREGYKTLEELNILTTNTSWIEGITVNTIPTKALGAQEYEDLGDILKELLPNENTDADGNLIPMKAQKFWKDDARTIPRIKFPCLGQPKINGIRCVAELVNGKVEFRSKKGLSYPLMTHIAAQFKDYMFKETLGLENPIIDVIFDGELYIPNTILADILSAVRKTNLMTPTVQFHAFDVAIPGFDQANRINILRQALNVDHPTPNIVCVETAVIGNLEEAIEFHKGCKAMGYEGSIFRSMDSEYGFGKRPMTMVKLKDKESLEFVIVDVIDTPNTPGIGMFVCRNDKNNETFRVVPEGNEELKRKYLEDRKILLGKMLTVEFYERTDAPKEVPFHATGIAVRDYE